MPKTFCIFANKEASSIPKDTEVSVWRDWDPHKGWVLCIDKGHTLVKPAEANLARNRACQAGYHPAGLIALTDLKSCKLTKSVCFTKLGK